MIEPQPERKLPQDFPRLSLFDPARPRLNGLPQLLRPDGSPTNSVLPALITSFCPDGRIRLWGYFHMEGSASAQRELYVESLDALLEVQKEWLACPEAVAVEKMGWWPRDRELVLAQTFKPPRQVQAELSIDDLLEDL